MRESAESAGSYRLVLMDQELERDQLVVLSSWYDGSLEGATEESERLVLGVSGSESNTLPLLAGHVCELQMPYLKDRGLRVHDGQLPHATETQLQELRVVKLS